jgi:AcrR family transcriptional regulator
MGRRAEHVDDTRQRITEATVRLHTTVGPAHTSIAGVAEEAGVTRLTVYRHFADLDELFEACRAHWVAQNPRPDTSAWTAIADLPARAERAFTELYRWYGDHAGELAPIYRDWEAMPRSSQARTAASNQELANALVGGFADTGSENGRVLAAVARHLTDFSTWRSLVIVGGLGQATAVDTAVRLLLAMVPARTTKPA